MGHQTATTSSGCYLCFSFYAPNTHLENSKEAAVGVVEQVPIWGHMASLVEREVNDLVTTLGLEVGVVKQLVHCTKLYQPGYEMNISQLSKITGSEIRANWYMRYAHGVEAPTIVQL